MKQDPKALQNMLSSLDPNPEPNDPAAEEALVSFLLARPDQAGELLGQLGPEDFLGERSRCTWMLAGQLQRMGIPIAPHALYDLTGLLKLEKHFERFTGGREYLDALAEDAPEAAFIPHAVRMVKSAAHRRKIVGLMGELKDLAGGWHGDNTELDEKVAAVLAYIQGGMKKRNPAGRLSFTAREMAEGAGREPAWLVPNLLLQGGVNLLAGEVSSGKTFLALDLAIALASGGVPWRCDLPLLPLGEGRDEGQCGTREQHGAQPHPTDLYASGVEAGQGTDCFVPRNDNPGAEVGQGTDCFVPRNDKTTKSPVLYFCLDTSRQTLQRRLAELCLGRGIDPPENLHFDLSPLDLSQPPAFTALKDMALARGAGLVILDALARYLPNVDENNVSSISPVLTGLRAIAAETGITILILHHLNKGAGYAQKTPSALRIRGSSDILAAVDTALVCTQGPARGGGEMYRNRSAHPAPQTGGGTPFNRVDSISGRRADTDSARRLIPVKNREQPESPPTSFRILPGEAGGVCIQFDSGGAGLPFLSGSTTGLSCQTRAGLPAHPALQPAPSLAEAILADLEAHPGQAFTRSQLRRQLHESGKDASRRVIAAAFTAIAAHPAVRVTRRGIAYSYTWMGEEAGSR